MRSYYYPAATLGEHPLCPSWPELIHRNKSSLRCVILKLRDSVLPGDREFYEEEARSLIRLHNWMVGENRTRLARSR